MDNSFLDTAWPAIQESSSSGSFTVMLSGFSALYDESILDVRSEKISCTISTFDLGFSCARRKIEGKSDRDIKSKVFRKKKVLSASRFHEDFKLKENTDYRPPIASFSSLSILSSIGGCVEKSFFIPPP